jgi:hypothetical protein
MFRMFPIHLRRTVDPGESSAVMFPLYPDEDVYKASHVLKFSKKSVRGILPQVYPALFYRMFIRNAHKGVHSDSISVDLWLYRPLLDIGRFFSFLILHTIGRTPWTGDQPVARPLHRTTQT